MKGRSPTKEDRNHWDKVSAIGCIACLKDGIKNSYVSIHHCVGRTKPGSHQKVLALCAQHHQHDDTDPMKRIGIHPFTARFENKYGKQMDLLAEIMELIGDE